jgi:hypothetical protein
VSVRKERKEERGSGSVRGWRAGRGGE